MDALNALFWKIRTLQDDVQWYAGMGLDEHGRYIKVSELITDVMCYKVRSERDWDIVVRKVKEAKEKMYAETSPQNTPHIDHSISLGAAADACTHGWPTVSCAERRLRNTDG